MEGHHEGDSSVNVDRVLYYQEWDRRHYPNLCVRRLVYRLGTGCATLFPTESLRILAVRPISPLFGMLQHKGPAVTLEEMEQAIADGACKG